MFVKKVIAFVALCGAVLMFAGCKSTPVDDFYEGDASQPEITEEIVMTTKFPEYDANTEVITATLVNNSDKEYLHGMRFFLQKLDGGDWRYINCSGAWQLIFCKIEPGQEGGERFDLKNHVKLPLLPGTYRVGFSMDGDESTPVAEFTVK